MKESVQVLPITTLDDEVVFKKQYPSNAQIAEWMNVKEEELTLKSKPITSFIASMYSVCNGWKR